MKLLERARAEIVALQPYSSARMEAGTGAIMLNANESPWPSVGAASALNRYPDPQPAALRAALARLYSVVPANVLVGRGSDEAIDLLVRAFCRAGSDAVVTAPPTFGMYAVAARIQGATVIEAPRGDGFVLDGQAILAAVTDTTKLVFVCTPNNPTGDVVPLAVLAHLAGALRDRAVLVVDEAYIEFGDDTQSAISLLSRHDNIAVLRTLSKAHALAAARVGALIAAAPVVALLRRIQAPYPLPAPSIAAALAALEPAALADTDARIARIRGERDRLARSLLALPGVIAVFASAANFLCVRFADAPGAYRALATAGIVVRDVGGYPGLSGCLRITVGAAKENAALLGALGACEAAA
ncbi:MAG TPA: histidinol-phosphate transaminase [Rudaea sp.]|nr:histidinol-phosphate transaminase [Rudaea sp.]